MFLPLLAVIILFFMWSIYWYAALITARNTFAQERARFANQGIVLACSRENWGGYPFRFEYECDEPQIDLNARGKISLQRMRAVALAYKPWQVMLFADGPTTVQPQGQTPITAEHRPATASLFLTSTQTGQVTVELADVNVANQIQAHSILASARNQEDGNVDGAVTVQGLKATVPNLKPIDIDQASADASLSPQEVLTLRSAQMQRGTLTLSATGTLQPDQNRKPQGSITLETNDPSQFLAAISEYASGWAADPAEALDEAERWAREGLAVDPHGQFSALGEYVLADVFSRKRQTGESAAALARGQRLEADAKRRRFDQEELLP